MPSSEREATKDMGQDRGTSTVSASRGRVVAFRIVAGVFGASSIIYSIASAVTVFTNESDEIHSFHVLGSIPAFLLLTGLAMVVLAIRPTDVEALRVAWAVTIGTVIASLFGEDFISGSYYIAPIVVVVLTVLSPVRGELLRFGSPTIALLSLAIVAAIPAIVYAWDQARIMLEGDPMHDPTGHWELHHWSGIAGVALGLVLAAIVVSFRHTGDRIWIWAVGIAAMMFGAVGVIFSDDVRYPSTVGTLWGVVILFAGIVFIAVAELADRASTDATA
jgi:hypothetical protein